MGLGIKLAAGGSVIAVVFWNLAKRNQTLPHLACLAQAHVVDVFLLAECPKNVKPALRNLNGLGIGVYREEVKAKAKVRAITRLPVQEFVHHATGIARELAVWKLRATQLNPSEVLLGGTHFPSKAGGLKETDQLSIAKEVMEELVEFEEQRTHRNTVLVGDFNMHPYDPGMTSVTGVHGQMTRALAEQADRRHRGVNRRRFYTQCGVCSAIGLRGRRERITGGRQCCTTHIGECSIRFSSDHV